MQYRTSAALLATVAGLVSAQGGQPTVTTPTSLVQCQPAQFTVSGGTAPYFVSIIPGGQAGAAALENLPTLDAAGPVTWNVDIAAGTSITVQVRDSAGVLNYSQQVTIQPGSTTNCAASASAGTGATASPSAPGSSAPVASSASSVSSSSSASSAGSASSASSASSVSRSSAASTTPAGSSRPAGSAAPSASAPASGASTLSTSFFGLAAAAVVALFA